MSKFGAKDIAASAALTPAKRERFLLPGQDRRPADVYILCWAGGLDAALNGTVVNLFTDVSNEYLKSKFFKVWGKRVILIR